MEAASKKEDSEVKVEMAEEEKTLNAKILDHDEWLSDELLATKQTLAATEKRLVEAEKDIVMLTGTATPLVKNSLAATRKWKAEYEKQIAWAERAVAEIEEQIARKTSMKKIQKKKQTTDSIVSAVATLAETKKWVDGYEKYVKDIKRHNDETKELIAKRPDMTLPWEERAAHEMLYHTNMSRVYIASAISSQEASKRKYNYAEFLEQVERAKKANAVIEEQMAKMKNAAMSTTLKKSEDGIVMSRRADGEVLKEIDNTNETTGQKSASCEEISMSRRGAGEENKEKRLKMKKTIRQKSASEAMSSRDEFDEDEFIEEQIAKIKNRALMTAGQKSEETTVMSTRAAGEEKKENRRKKKKTLRQKSEEAIAMSSRDEFDYDEFEEQIAKLAATLAAMHNRRVSHEGEDASTTWTVEIEGLMG